MALDEAERQAAHRKTVEETSADATPDASDHPREAGVEAVLEEIRGRFRDGMVDLLHQGNYHNDECAAVREPRRAALARFEALGEEGRWRLLMAGLHDAGRKAALQILEECFRDWKGKP